MHNFTIDALNAKLEARRLGAPEKAYQAHRAHLNNCRRRKIAMLFSFAQWWTWWQTDSRWENRGVRKGQLVMARFNDEGPYCPDNVYCCTHQRNTQDISQTKRSWAIQDSYDRRRLSPSWKSRLSVRGDGHPRSRAVITPTGRFGSAALAAEAYGISRQEAGRRAKNGRMGWRYEADERGQSSTSADRLAGCSSTRRTS